MNILLAPVRLLGYTYRRLVRPNLPRTGTATYAGLQTSFDFRAGDALLPRRFRPTEVENLPAYEDKLIAAQRRFIKPGDRLVIVGGGVGVTAAAAGTIVGPGGSVLCFEASRRQFPIVVECQRRNGVADIVDVRLGTVGAAIDVYWKKAGLGPVVPATDLPECDVLGMDCEGAEKIILDAMTIRPPVIIVETHGVYGSPTSNVKQQLERLGYHVEDTGVASDASRRFAEPRT